LFRTVGPERPDLKQRLAQLKDQDGDTQRRLEELAQARAKLMEQSQGALSEPDKLRLVNQIRRTENSIEVLVRKRREFTLRKNIWDELGHGDIDIHARVLEIDMEETRMVKQGQTIDAEAALS
jgi:uncharacterized protein (DUF3084 family)